MKKLTLTACALATAGVALFTCGCNDNLDKQPGTHYFYKMDAQDPAALDASDLTMAQEPEKEDTTLAEYVQRYDAGQARPVQVARPAAKSVVPPLDEEYQKTIDAAKERIDALRGSYSLAKNGAITAVRVTSQDATLDDMKLIGRLTDLETFFFEGVVFNDEMLAELKDLKKVKTAQIKNSDITVETLKMLATYPELTTLDIQRDLKIESSDLTVLTEFPKLERLLILYNSFSNSALNKISKSTTIKTVDVRGCQDVSDVGAKYLAKMPQLEELFFRFSITNGGVEYLANAPSLKFVEFQDCQIDNDCAPTLAKFPALTGLRIFRSKSFTDDGVKGLTNLKLERLELRDLTVSDEGVAGLKDMDSLRSVELSELTDVTEEGLNALVGSPAWSNMETLDLFTAPSTDETVKIIASNMKNLKSLQIRASLGKNTDATIDEILKIDSLVSLDLRENGGLSVDAFMKLAQMKNLRKLYIKNTNFGASDQEVVKKRDEFKKLNPKISLINEG